MISKNINEITEEDLQSLIDNKVLESKTIEYKEKLPDNSDREKKEFLADVSAFANAGGGDLIYGIVENEGYPVDICGVDTDNPDQEILRLDNMLRDGIDPRITGVSIESIILSNTGKKVLLIRIPKSWRNPHRVIYKGHNQFYVRHNNSRPQMDVGELRVAFNLSETLAEKIKKFREDRVGKIFANETPVFVSDWGKVALHMIPLNAFHPVHQFEINKLNLDLFAKIMWPINAKNLNGWNPHYNFDGIMNHAERVHNGKFKLYSYVQFFKNGIIEAVDETLLYPYQFPWNNEVPEKGTIKIAYEKEIIESLKKYLNVLENLNVELPILIYLNLVNVKGYVMQRDQKKHYLEHFRHPIDREILLIPEVLIESYDIDPAKVLKPCFDSVWNACGASGSENYDEDGEWTG